MDVAEILVHEISLRRDSREKGGDLGRDIVTGDVGGLPWRRRRVVAGAEPHGAAATLADGIEGLCLENVARM